MRRHLLRQGSVQVIVVGAALAVAGCASMVRIYEGPERPATEIALLHPSSEYERSVLSSSYTEFAGAGVSNRNLSGTPKIYFVEVDGRSVPGFGNKSLEVEAGKHKLKFRAVAPGGTNKVLELSIDVRGGGSYDVGVFEEGNRSVVMCKPIARWERD